MEIFVLKSDEVAAITRGTHGNPHHILGMHQCLNDCYVNAYLPRATAAFVLRINEETGEPISYDRDRFTGIFYSEDRG